MPTLQQCDLSIIVPVYNLERYIGTLLNTLEHQDTNGYTVEYIFVLNNCTDHSEGIIRSSKLDVRILQCKQQGCGPARNTGLEAAKGKYIWFMDGDDWLTGHTAIRDVLDKAEEVDADIIWIPFVSDRFNWDYYSMVWQYLFRREFIKDNRFPDFQPAEDDAFMAEVLSKAGYNIHNYKSLPHLDKPQYYYNYMREGSNMYRYCILGESI